MRRLGLVLMVAMVSLALWPSAAWAGAPERRPFESEDGLLPAGPCPFPVFIHVVANNEYTIEFFDDSGNLIRTIFQGRVVLEFTNTQTGTSVTRNVSGPATKTEADQIIVKTGPWLFFSFPGELGPEEPGSMFINYGRVVEFTGTPHEIISQTGVKENLCDTLGAAPESEVPGATVRGSSDDEVLGADASESPAVEPFLGAAVTGRPAGDPSGAEASAFDVRPLQSPTYATPGGVEPTAS